jgi:hypothetical protein
MRTGLVATAALALFAAPLVADLGGRPDNPSLRPRDYRSGLLIALAVVWLACLVSAAIATRRDGPRSRNRADVPDRPQR